MPFTLGQRWISDTESELGLGTVIAVDNRMVTLLFPATGENRLYATSDSPLTRVIFNPGDTVTSHEGWQLEIEQVNHDKGLVNYVGTRLDNQEYPVTLREVLLDSRLVFSKPQDRLFAGQLDRMDRFALRYRARHYHAEQYRLPISGLRGMRTNLIPHQLHIAHDVGQRHAPRVLLADEVGLGKTIEAGMILHQQLLAGRAERVLIVLPETLQHQWLVEMLRRFNLRFSLFDDERYRNAQLDATNAFETEQLVICSLDFVCKSNARLQALQEANWDLLIVDEAHHLAWEQDEPSKEYQAIEKLATEIPGVLLLTATPEQLGLESHFARLRLLDPNRFHDFAAFVEEQKHFRPVVEAVNGLLDDAPLSSQACSLISDLLPDENSQALLQSINLAHDDQHAARQTLIRQLMDRHGTSRVLFRNTRSGITGFPQRHLNAVGLPLPAQYQTAFNVNALMNANKAPEVRAKALLYPEKIYQEIEGDSGTWWDFDPRVAWLMGFLTQHRTQKVLVICAQAATALQLEQVLREREGIKAAVFHEGLSIIERDRAAAWFASEEEGAQVLLCSEIGSEGRNFQFASQLVMFDLPFNPDLLEQRIGRLDRIGQQNDIMIHIPWLEKSAQSVLFRWYHEGLDAFEHTCPGGRAIYDTVHQQLMNFLIAFDKTEGLESFIAECRQQHDAMKAQLEQGRDRLLELNSQGGEAAQELAEAIGAQDNDIALINFAFNLFDIIGINQEDRSDNLMVLTPGDHMLVPDFPSLPEEGCTITFDRHQALSREDAQYVTWEHPLIRNGLDLILSGDTGSCALSLLKNKALPVGTLLVELIYVVEAQAPKHLQLTRFLPPTPLRLLIDSQGNDLAAKVEFESFNRQLNAINRHNANKLVNALQQDVHAILMLAEERVVPQAQQIIHHAQQEAEKNLDAELSRLVALQQVNPNIRQDEIEALEDNRQQILSALNDASWRLDAQRLIVVTHQ
ncbi:MAG: RNA polymerase-associated protein RapA [Candidatus Erwinia impunctatus]|nr:RNA polymerase-associated protein RapA [Culicoides impunctatus]